MSPPGKLKFRCIDHIVLNVADVDRSIEFYRTIFGFQTERLEQFRAGKVPFPSLRVDARTIIDLFPNDSAAPSGSVARTNVNHVSFCVENSADEVVHALAGLGIPIERGPVQNFGANGTGTAIYVRDPDMNLVELRVYASKP